MTIDVNGLIRIFKEYGYQLTDLLNIFETSNKKAKKILQDYAMITLNYNEAKALLKKIQIDDAKDLMNTGVVQFARAIQW